MLDSPANQPSALLDAKTLLDGIIGAIVGGALGVLGALMTLRAEGSKRRTEVAVNILERYMSEFQEIGEVNGLLASPALLFGPDYVHLLNRVIRIGDWYDIVSGLCLYEVADSPLLEKMGFKKQMKHFLDKVCLAIPHVPELSRAAKHWSQLESYTGVTLLYQGTLAEPGSVEPPIGEPGIHAPNARLHSQSKGS